MAAAALVFAGRLVRLQGVKNGSTGFLLEDFGRRLLTTRASSSSSSSSSLFAAAVVGSGSQRPFPLATWKTPTSRFEDVFHWRRRLLSSAAESEPEAKDSSQNQKKLDSAALLKVHSANALDASGPREKKWPHKVCSSKQQEHACMHACIIIIIIIIFFFFFFSLSLSLSLSITFHWTFLILISLSLLLLLFKNTRTNR